MLEVLFDLWANREALRGILSKHPFFAPFIFVLVQALQVIIAPLPGEVTGFIAGFVFGAFKGFLLSTLGIFLGSFVAFSISKFFKEKFLKAYEAHPFYQKTNKVLKKWGSIGIFLLYLFPGFPKDLLNYFLGLTPIKLRAFLILSTLGRLPATLALCLQGDAVFSGDPKRIFITAGAFLIAFFFFLLLRKKIDFC